MCDLKIANDPVNSPSHYMKAAITIEPIELTARLDSCLGQALQYVFRAPYKGNEREDLEKARFYLYRESELMSMRGDEMIGPLSDETSAFIRVFYYQTGGLVHRILEEIFNPRAAQIFITQGGLYKAVSLLGKRIGQLMQEEHDDVEAA